MILLGAGASTPFRIPGMIGFTDKFIAENQNKCSLVLEIREALKHSKDLIGTSIQFDLEALLSVLNDLSGLKKEKPISIPTASLLFEENLTLQAAREKYGLEAESALGILNLFIFNTCMQPIRTCRKERSFKSLDRFYGPLMTVLNSAGLRDIQGHIQRVFSTNWDLCFKTWAENAGISIIDGTVLDEQSQPVLGVEVFDRSTPGFFYVPLHGSLDMIKTIRSKGTGIYEDILKIPEITRFEANPENLKDIFIIYPLEAIGYEESVKSPYLDMLYYFKKSLIQDGRAFIVGYSLRDPTIGSILEEVLAERIRKGGLKPMQGSLDSRVEQAGSYDGLKIVALDRNPDELEKTLKKQGYTNLLQTVVAIKTEFPEVAEENFAEKYGRELHNLIVKLVYIRHMTPDHADRLADVLWSRYQISLPEAFPWKKTSTKP